MKAEITINLCKGQMNCPDEYLLRIESEDYTDKINFIKLDTREAEVLSKFFYLDLPTKQDALQKDGE